MDPIVAHVVIDAEHCISIVPETQLPVHPIQELVSVVPLDSVKVIDLLKSDFKSETLKLIKIKAYTICCGVGLFNMFETKK